MLQLQEHLRSILYSTNLTFQPFFSFCKSCPLHQPETAVKFYARVQNSKVDKNSLDWLVHFKQPMREAVYFCSRQVSGSFQHGHTCEVNISFILLFLCLTIYYVMKCEFNIRTCYVECFLIAGITLFRSTEPKEYYRKFLVSIWFSCEW